MLRELGLPAAKAEMASFGDKRVLVVERFDRLLTDDKRILRLPQEDCCQALSVSPNLKYESDGGPGIENILHLLQGSDEPIADQRSFLKANIIFWLLGATDGNAKNFSVFLSSGGRFRLTPFYDVISAQPSVDAKQILWKQFRLAMAVGSKHHYKIGSIAPRHFFQTAKKSGVSEKLVKDIIGELRDSASATVDSVDLTCPQAFPKT
jgi:serine/threonine-protein kinase HipA